MPLASAFDKCNCGQPNDREGYHLLTCKHGGGPIWTHGTIVSVWSDCLRNLSITHRTEPRELYDGNQCRPDIVYFDAQTGCDIEMDISIAHPWNGDVISNASREDGAAAVRREQQKAMKYSHQFDIFDNPSNCIPVVFEHYGRWGLKAQQLLYDLSLLSFDEDGQKNGRDFMTYWRRCLSVALQRCNARVITRKLSSLAKSNSCSVDLYSLQLFKR